MHVVILRGLGCYAACLGCLWIWFVLLVVLTCGVAGGLLHLLST